jgi:hypothetical protein
MSIKEYARDRFDRDIKKMKFQNGLCINENRTPEKCRWFGGPRWKDYSDNIKHVSQEDLANFVATLFSTVAFDYNMYRYFGTEYRKVQNPFMNIKMGKPNPDGRFGLINVRVIVDRAQKKHAFEGLDDSFVKEWAEFFLSNVQGLLKDSNVLPTDFMKKLLADSSFKPGSSNDGHIFDQLVRELRVLSAVL